MFHKLNLQPIKDNNRNIFYLTYHSLCSSARWKIEGRLFLQNLHIIILFWVVQLVHSAACNFAYFRHVQAEPLRDFGFETIPPLHPSLRHLSEIITFTILITVFLLSFLTFFQQPTPVYWAAIIIRMLVALTVCAIVRMVTFLSTALPGPAPHCQLNSTDYNPPKTTMEILFRKEIFNGCGDLIFSSHTALTMCFVLAVYTYLHLVLNKTAYRIICFGFYWPLLFVNIIFIIAARKHYTVDILVALYTTPFLWNLSYRIFPEIGQNYITQSTSSMVNYLENNKNNDNNRDRLQSQSMMTIKITGNNETASLLNKNNKNKGGSSSSTSLL